MSLQVLEAVDDIGRTPLYHALEEGSLDIFSTLLSAGCNPNSLTPQKQHLVAHTVENQMEEFLHILLKVCSAHSSLGIYN